LAAEAVAVDRVAVADQILRRLVERKRLADLLGDPSGVIRILLLTFLAARPRAAL
jgi:hypothetical protein